MSSSARLAALLVVLFVLPAMPTGSVSAAAYPEPRPPSVHAGHLYRSAELNAFFAVPSGFYFGDPGAIYDAQSARWFLSGFALSNPFGTQSQTYLAVSQSSDPMGAWNIYRSQIRNYLADQPKIATTNDKV